MDSTAVDRAIRVVAAALPSNTRDSGAAALEAWAAVEALLAHPDVLQALAATINEPADPPELVNDEVSRIRYHAPDQLANEGPRGVILRHGPTGIEAGSHSERSALQNTVIAFRELRAAVAASRAVLGVEA